MEAPSICHGLGVWKERNRRMFEKQMRTKDQVWISIIALLFYWTSIYEEFTNISFKDFVFSWDALVTPLNLAVIFLVLERKETNSINGIEQQDKKGKESASIDVGASASIDGGASTQSKFYSPSISLENLTNSIRDKLGCPNLPKNPSIFKVHEKFQKVSTNAYTPELVSIGPFHRENETLRCMQEHKLCYAKTFISRSGIDLRNYVESMMSINNVARDCYSVRFSEVKDDEFVEMMLLDGLFIIELFQKYAGEPDHYQRKDDPIFTNSWTISSLIRDLVLLENQIPMLVLRTLFEKTMSSSTESYSTFLMLALRFFVNLLTPMDLSKVDRNGEITQSKHLLDLLGKSLFYRPTLSPTTNTTNISSRCASFSIDMIQWPCKEKKWTFLPCATELNRAGIEFKRASWEGSFLDISFRNGVLEIPAISIQDQTEVLFRNLIAYEQSSDGNTLHTISYAFFMDNLIDSHEDVKFLCDAGIITNYLGDHHDVSKLFNRLLCEVAMGDNFYLDLYGKVNEYYNTPQHAWRATLKREYFKNPWTIFSLIAAFILLGLTITQTIYTVKAYVTPVTPP